MSKIIDDDDRLYLLKGGPGSGRYPAGSGDNPGAGGAKLNLPNGFVGGKKKQMTVTDGTVYTLQENTAYQVDQPIPLPNGKNAKQYVVSRQDGTPVGDITERTSYKDTKLPGSRIVDRKDVVGYSAKTYNEAFPIYERTTFSNSLSFCVDVLHSRSKRK